MGNGVFRFRVFRFLGDEHVRLMFNIHGRIMVEQVMELSSEVAHSGGGSSVHSTYVQDDRPLAPPPIHVTLPVDEEEDEEEESDEDYVADSDLSDNGDEDESVPEIPVQTVARHVLPPPHPILALSAMPSHYHSLDLDAMHERTPFSDTGEEDYNLEDGVGFRKPSHHREETHSSPLTTDRHSCSLSSLRFSPSPTLSHTTLTFAILVVADDRRCCCTDHRSSSPFYPNRLLRALIADDRRCSDHRCCCAIVTIVISVLLIIILSVLTSLNMYGHCHPKILKALTKQAEKLTLSSRAFYNDQFPPFAEHLTSMLGYDMVLPMNTGAEGVEIALKLARKWGYEKKRIPKDEAIIVSCCGCFHGCTLAVISMSCDNEATRGFGPLLPGHLKVDFGDAEALERIFKEKGEHIASFLLEPIQGEAGVIIPPDGYLKVVRDLCTRYNVLMIADEIQTGLARTGKMLACDWEEVRPDVVILGKALGGGVFSVSAVLADKDVMLCIKPGEHGSTFGGNPLASSELLKSYDYKVLPKGAKATVSLWFSCI
ncbi:ornithine aminotransferase, mitochondrial-like [Arachis duranensis]|uniref:ornithine aminotransferase n=1 Tax=Arachis duranensis TaxID=130453 RepID=A0A9C6TTP3_ARADU|nr:ornithine aminotransferase, mitochondrial-like [Arachis duranensis]